VVSTIRYGYLVGNILDQNIEMMNAHIRNILKNKGSISSEVYAKALDDVLELEAERKLLKEKLDTCENIFLTDGLG
jgi:CobQ-like glutamine amidotransferase family enzyme